jgi:hypothetical protein
VLIMGAGIEVGDGMKRWVCRFRWRFNVRLSYTHSQCPGRRAALAFSIVTLGHRYVGIDRNKE